MWIPESKRSHRDKNLINNHMESRFNIYYIEKFKQQKIGIHVNCIGTIIELLLI